MERVYEFYIIFLYISINQRFTFSIRIISFYFFFKRSPFLSESSKF